MPNHITNILTITGDEQLVKDCLSKISGVYKDNDGNDVHLLIDFSKIEPIPKIRKDRWVAVNMDSLIIPRNQQMLDERTIQFDTDWHTPFLIIRKLSKEFPELTFKVEFSGEELEKNCGLYEFSNGIILTEYQPKGEESHKFACRVKGINYESSIINRLKELDLRGFKDDKMKEVLYMMMKKGYDADMAKNIDDKNKEGLEKLKYLEEIAVEKELYESASKFSVKRSD